MVHGIVKRFNKKKGYGFIMTFLIPRPLVAGSFIEHEDGPDVFVHHTGIKADGFRALKEDELVRFDIEQGKKGPAAVNVTVV